MTAPFNEFYKGKTVLVTGHTGFKGAWLAMWLRKLGARVIGYSTSPPTKPSHFEICNIKKKIAAHVEADVRDYQQLRAVCEAHRPEIVFHLAAQSLVRSAFDDPRGTFDTNVMGTVNILEAVRFTPSVKTCVVVTSDKVYLNVGWEWAYRENDRIGGHEAYSTSKACVELVTAVYQDMNFQRQAHPGSAVAIASARAGNAIGGGDWAQHRIIPDVIRAITNGKELVIRHPEATRPWQHALEAISGYLQLAWLLTELPDQYRGAWNFGPRNERLPSVGELVQRIMELWPAENVPIKVVPDDTGREKLILGVDCSKARHRMSWQATWSVAQTIQATVDWYRGFYSGVDMETITNQQIERFTLDAAAQQISWALGNAPPSNEHLAADACTYPAASFPRRG